MVLIFKTKKIKLCLCQQKNAKEIPLKMGICMEKVLTSANLMTIFFLLLSMLSVYNQFISHAGVEGGGKNKIPGQQYKLPPPPTQPSNVHKKSKPG